MNKLLVFTASWCAPCKALKPTLAQLDQDRLVYYDIDTALEERAKHSIGAVPTLILVDESGTEISRHVGQQSLSSLQALLDV